MQMAGATTTAVPTARATRAPGGLANFQRIHQRIKTLREQLVDLGDHATQLNDKKVALHHVHYVLHQQIALHLHDGSRRGPNE